VPALFNAVNQFPGIEKQDISSVKSCFSGSAPLPEDVQNRFEKLTGARITEGFGLTETSPLGTLGSLTHHYANQPFDAQVPVRLKQGRPPLGVDLKLCNDEGQRLPHDGKTFGRLMVRGPTISKAYMRLDKPILDEEGYFDTGDVATIDAYGYMQITDRAKDVIKSGGEWISSIDIENLAAGHPKVAIAAVIGVFHPKWDERPLLIIQLKPGETSTKEEMGRFLKEAEKAIAELEE